MLLSRGHQYALQALVKLALRPPGEALMCRELAEDLDLPYPYLSKLMQHCAHLGLVGASRGRSGGYWLGNGVEAMTVRDLYVALNGERKTRECLLGFKECGDETACVMHVEWKPLKEGVFELMASQTLAELAAAVREGRSRLGEVSPGCPLVR